MPERPPGNPHDLLGIWLEWEKGEAMPGKVMSDLKRLGLRELLDALAAATPADTTSADTTSADTTPADTTPADTTHADTTPVEAPSAGADG